MKVLYINKTCSGPMEPVARFISRREGVSAVFMAERWPKEMDMPGIMRVRIPISASQAGTGKSVEKMMSRNVLNSARVKELCMRLRKSGFVPNVVYVTAQDGYALGVAEVFPDARIVARTECFYGQTQPCSDAVLPIRRLSAVELMHNAAQLLVFNECALGITSTHWQKNLLLQGVADKLHVVGMGVDTQFFQPKPESCVEEVVTFSCQGTNPARGIHIIGSCLPELLAARPKCKVRLISFGTRRSEAAKSEHEAVLRALLPPMHEAQQQRVEIVVSPSPANYLKLLQSSSAYVYLTAPTQLSAGILEAMSCGIPVLASDTAPVRECITHGENGVLWDGANANDLSKDVAQLLASVPSLNKMRKNARSSILEQHDLRKLLPQHAALVLGTELCQATAGAPVA